MYHTAHILHTVIYTFHRHINNATASLTSADIDTPAVSDITCQCCSPASQTICSLIWPTYLLGHCTMSQQMTINQFVHDHWSANSPMDLFQPVIQREARSSIEGHWWPTAGHTQLISQPLQSEPVFDLRKPWNPPVSDWKATNKPQPSSIEFPLPLASSIYQLYCWQKVVLQSFKTTHHVMICHRLTSSKVWLHQSELGLVRPE